MTENVYAAPQAELVSQAQVLPFYVVSVRKFRILYIGTAGLYGVYWFFCQWRAWRDHSGDKVIPALRAIFSIFFVHKLFAHADDKAADAGAEGFEHRRMATTFVWLSVVSYLLDRFAYKSIGSPFTDIVSILVLFLFVPLMGSAQTVMNAACADPSGDTNDRLTGANIVWLVIGGLLWLLAGLGVLTEIAPQLFTGLQ